MRAVLVKPPPDDRKFRKPALVCDETFHQKLSVPGPFVVVLKVDVCPSAISPLRPAANPSCDTFVNPCQTVSPPVAHGRLVAFSASGSGTVGITTSVAIALVTDP